MCRSHATCEYCARRLPNNNINLTHLARADGASGRAHRFDLQVCKVGAHAAMAASSEPDERELRSLVLAAGRQEPLEVVCVGVLEQLLRAMLHAGRCAADVAFWDVELPTLRVCSTPSCGLVHGPSCTTVRCSETRVRYCTTTAVLKAVQTGLHDYL